MRMIGPYLYDQPADTALAERSTDESEADRLRSILLRMKPLVMRQGALWELLQEALGDDAR